MMVDMQFIFAHYQTKMLRDKRKRSITDIFSDVSSRRPRIGDYEFTPIGKNKRKRNEDLDELEQAFSRVRLHEPKPESIADQLAHYRSKHAMRQYSRSGGKRKKRKTQRRRRRSKLRTRTSTQRGRFRH